MYKMLNVIYLSVLGVEMSPSCIFLLCKMLPSGFPLIFLRLWKVYKVYSIKVAEDKCGNAILLLKKENSFHFIQSSIIRPH